MSAAPTAPTAPAAFTVPSPPGGQPAQSGQPGQGGQRRRPGRHRRALLFGGGGTAMVLAALLVTLGLAHGQVGRPRRPFKWTKTAEQMIGCICRYCSRISRPGH
jgi:hypothetical protein